jgi:photosystem II stability/assembly factor-like uncharacterized protein
MSPLALSAQKLNFDHLKGMQFRNIGPAGMSGRITSIDVVRDNPEVMYAAAASGGIWKSESGGTTWKPVFDEYGTGSVGAVAICQQNPDMVWAATGEGNPRNTQNSGIGIFLSRDAGKTWTNMGLKDSRTIHRIIVHPNDPNTVFVAATGSAWGPNAERGVFRTTDGGKSWKKILFVNDSTGCADLVMDPSNPNKLMAAMWQYNRLPWIFTSGGKGSGLYVTHDGGETWVKRTDKDGLPKGNLGRMGLAIAASNPNVVYALVESKATALYRSDDGGVKWRQIASKNIGNRPFYYCDIYVHPKNENTVFNLYSVVSKSIDGGKTFETILPYSGVHPDHHAWYVHPDNPDFMINGNDGGLNITYDGGRTWRFVGNLPIGQFYHVNVDNDMPYNVYGGLQDNGSWVGPSAVWQDGGIRNHHWQEVLFGDGFDVMPRADDNRFLYAMYQGGNLYMVDKTTGEEVYIRPNHPQGLPLRFNWNAALAQDPFEKGTIYYGSQFVHKSKNFGLNWEIISPDLTTNDTTKQKQALSGGLTIDATAAENHTTILCIVPSALEQGVMWVGTDDGNVQVTRDAGATWTNVIGNIKDAPKGAWIPYIEVSRHKKGEAFVVLNDYRRNNWKPYVFRTTDYGKTWTRIVKEQPDMSFALCVVQDPVQPNLFFLGTDDGLYISLDDARTWQKWNKRFPAVPVNDMKIHPRENDLVVATFGRALWILDDITPLRELAKAPSLLDKPLHVFPSDTSYMVNYKSVNGERFDANAVFHGHNERRGLGLAVYLKQPGDPAKSKAAGEKEENKDDNAPASDKPAPDWEKMRVVVRTMGGDTIRRFSVKPDTGLQRVYWHFERDGIEYPQWKKRDTKADPPWGHRALPGAYQVSVIYGTFKDSTVVQVKYDPRTMLRDKQLKGQDEALKKLHKLVKASTTAFNQMRDAKATMAMVGQNLEGIDPEKKKAIEKKGKELSDTLAKIMDEYMLPDESELFDHVTKRLVDRFWELHSYIMSYPGAMLPNTQVLYDALRRDTDAILERANAFFRNQWPLYRQMVDEARVSPFREVKEVKIED